MLRRRLLPYVPAAALLGALIAEVVAVRPTGGEWFPALVQLVALTLAWTFPVAFGAMGLVALLRWLAGGEERLRAWAPPLLVVIPAAFLFVAAARDVLVFGARAFNDPRLFAAVAPIVLLVVGALLALAVLIVWRLAGARLRGLPPRVVAIAAAALAVGALVLHVARFPTLMRDASFGAAVLLAALVALTAAAVVVVSRGRAVTVGARAAVAYAAGAVAVWGLHLGLPRAEALRVPFATAAAAIQHRGLVAARLGAFTARAIGDQDEDGYVSPPVGLDCDDGRAAVHPLATEVVGNGVDEDCWGGDLTAAALEEDRRARLAELTRPRAAARTKNVVLITMDALRHDGVGFGGAPHPSSPALDALARRGAIFRRAYAHAPSTRRSTPSLLSGRLPANVHWIRKPDFAHDCADENVFLAERLRDAGWATGSVVSYNYAKNARFDQGFADRAVRKGEKSAKQIVDESIRLVERWHGEGKRFFLWAHFYEPHYPYEKHATVTPFGKEPFQKYLGEVRAVDDQLARLFATLDSLGLTADTTIILTSDHGEEFGEHGGTTHGDLYEEDLRVPLFFSGPGIAPRELTGPVASVDLTPTVLELTGVPYDPLELDGVSLVPLIDGTAPAGAPERPVLAELLPDKKVARRVIAWIGPRWKLVLDPQLGTRELYDLTADPGEKTNVYASHTRLAADLEGAFRRFASFRLRAGSVRQ